VNTNVPAIRHEKSFRTWLRESSVGTHIVMVIVLIVIFVPVLWLIGTTFKDRLEFSTNTAAIIPSHFSLVNYEYMFSAIEQLPTYMANSFILAIGTTLIQVFCASLAGYAFSRLHFRGRDLIFVAIIVSMFIPRSGGLMALYELMTFLHLRNSLVGLILLFGSGVPVTIFIMRQTFLSVPREIEESALIDGANWFMVFWKIALPLAAGGIVVVATLAFIGAWSDFLTTYTLIDKDSQMTISIGIQKVLATSYEAALSPRFRGQFAGEASDATMLVFAAFPVVLLYALLQKWFMKGLMEGAVKL
ncbi:MAG TPA: carbohydrate ABC transporter permease, partial [Anaerolineae bacterium]